MSPNTSPPGDPGVELVEALGEWFVRVTQSGNTEVSSFEREEFALSFSEGQAVRLGVGVTRL